MKIAKIAKLVAINIATFLVLLACVNWLCGFLLNEGPVKGRENLTNYSDDFDHAKQVFKDYNSVQHQYEPFVGWKTLPYKGKTLEINADGNRVTPSTGNDKKTLAVHFFGGSTMWGEGSDDQHTIPALVGAKNPSLDIWNHGQLAYNSRQELDALITLYSTGKTPDIVIFYDGVNDAAFLCPKEITKLPAHRLVPMYREKLYAGKSAIIKELAGKVFIRNILLAARKYTEKKNKDNSPYDCVSNPAKAEAIADMMMMHWEMAHEIVSKRNGKFIAILQPAAYIGRPKTDHLSLDPDLGENFKVIYKKFRQKIKEKNYPWVVDLSERFNGDEPIFIDFCHVSPNGNQIIANDISKLIGETTPMSDVAFSSIHP